jgi:hypothetical protein
MSGKPYDYLNRGKAMGASWSRERAAVAACAVVCLTVLVFPILAGNVAGYYLRHPVVIPLWARVLMTTGVFVKMLRLPIILGAGITAFLISLKIGKHGSVQ